MSEAKRKEYLLAVYSCEKRHALSVNSLSRELGVRKSMASLILSDFRKRGYLSGEDVRHLFLSGEAVKEAAALERQKEALKEKLGAIFHLGEKQLDRMAGCLLFNSTAEFLA